MRGCAGAKQIFVLKSQMLRSVAGFKMFDVAATIVEACRSDATFAVTAQKTLLAEQGVPQGVFDESSQSDPAGPPVVR